MCYFFIIHCQNPVPTWSLHVHHIHLNGACIHACIHILTTLTITLEQVLANVVGQGKTGAQQQVDVEKSGGLVPPAGVGLLKRDDGL